MDVAWVCMCFSKNYTHDIRSLIYYIITVALNAGVIISAIVGFARSSKFTSSFDGATCSIINFIEHTMNGEEKTDLPKWIGTHNIVSSLDSLGSIPDTLNTEYSKVFEVSSYTTLASDDTAYEGLIDKAPTSDGTDGLYIPVDATGVYPAYIKGFASTSAQYYQSLLEEYNTIIKSNIANINNLKTTVEGIQSSTALGSTLNTYKSTFGSIQSAIADVGDPAIDFKVRDKAFDLFLLSFKILYGVFLALAACLITLISLYVWLRFTILKLPTHIVWNVAMLICFLT